MKKLLFIVAIIGFVFTSCDHSTKKAKSETRTEEHKDCDHDHGNKIHSHDADANHHQEEFTVDSIEHPAHHTEAEHEQNQKKGQDHQH